MAVGLNESRREGRGKSDAVCVALWSAVAGLEALMSDGGPIDIAERRRLKAAEEAVRRALVALDSATLPVRSARLVGLTIDEAARVVGVVELLRSGFDDELDGVAGRATAVLQERMRAVSSIRDARFIDLSG